MDFAFAEYGQSVRLFIDLDPVSTCIHIHNPPAVVPYPRELNLKYLVMKAIILIGTSNSEMKASSF